MEQMFGYKIIIVKGTDLYTKTESRAAPTKSTKKVRGMKTSAL